MERRGQRLRVKKDGEVAEEHPEAGAEDAVDLKGAPRPESDLEVNRTPDEAPVGPDAAVMELLHSFATFMTSRLGEPNDFRYIDLNRKQSSLTAVSNYCPTVPI